MLGEVIDRKRRKITTELNGDHLTINNEVEVTQARLSEDWYGKAHFKERRYLKDVERIAEDEVKEVKENRI